MSNTALLYPVLAHVALVFVLAVIMFNRRVEALKAREASLKAALFPADAFPPRATLAANAYQNQFEMPVLFYAVIAFSIIFGAVSIWQVALAWAYVAARLVHAYLHVSGASAVQRLRPFAVSFILLLALWVLLAIHVILR
jgi:hypothetical protein